MCVYNRFAFPNLHEVFTKSLHTHRAAAYKTTTNQRHMESKEREWDKRGVEEFKSLPLFRLVVAVVCCLVFPLWVNEHTSSENITTLSWFQAAVYTYTQIHKHAHTDRQRIMFTGTRLYVVSGRLTKHHSWPLLSSLIQWGGSE